MVGFGTLPYKTHAKQGTLLYQNKTFLPKTMPVDVALFAYFAANTTSGAMVGFEGTILKYNSDLFEFEVDPASGVVTTETLRGIWFAGADNGVAVGEGCTILAWDGTDWTLADDSGMLPNVRLQSVVHFGAFLIACGYDEVTYEGVILHKGFYIDPVTGYEEHDNWTEVYRSSDIPRLKEIDAYTPTNILCAGSSGKYVESADWGNTWTIKQTPAKGEIRSLSFGETDYGFGVTSLGEFIMWDGTSWTLLPSPTIIDLNSVHVFSREFALAVGNAGLIFAWDGNFWRSYITPTGYPLYCILGITANFCWVCGYAGFIAQFQSETYPSLLIDTAGNAMGGHGKVIGKVEGSENLPIKQKDDGTLHIVTALDKIQIFEDEDIRDTNAHKSDIGDCSYFNIITIWVENGLDDGVSVQIKGNMVNSTTGAVDIGDAFNVATVDREARTMKPGVEGFLPFIFIEVVADGVPNAGNLNAYLIRKPI